MLGHRYGSDRARPAAIQHLNIKENLICADKEFTPANVFALGARTINLRAPMSAISKRKEVEHMGHPVTPNCITNDLIIYDTNSQGWTGMMVPVNISGRKIHGKLQIKVDSLSDLSDLKKILHDQPQATYRGMYEIEIQIYVADEDELATFHQRWGLDVVPSVFQVVGAGDVKIEWKC